MMNSLKATVGVGKLPLKIQSSQNRLCIKGGTVVNDDEMFQADVFIEDGVIRQVGQNLIIPGGCRVINANGLLIMPGGIDTHTHMEMPFMGTVSSDDFYSGTRAALAGGTTMIIDFVMSDKESSILHDYNKYRERADSKVCCDYALHVIVSHFDAKVAKEVELLAKEKGVNSFKAFMAYSFKLEDDELYDLLRTCRKVGALVQVHAENGKAIERLADELFEAGVRGPEGHLHSRPTSVEVEATNRAVTLAKLANCPLYVVHVMSRYAAEVIGDARRNGQVVFGEVIAAALALDGSHYCHSCWRHAAGYVMSPPLRSDPNNAEVLMKLLANGDLQCTGTDHCVFRSDQKAAGKDDFRKIPNGVNGVEDRMSVIWQMGVVTGLLDPCKFVATTSTNAAKIFNIYPKKGRIAVGSDADVIVWNPETSRTISKATHHQNVDFNVFEGMTCRGVPDAVITRGMVVFDRQEDEEALKVIQGHGRYVETPCHSRYVYGCNEQKEKLRKVIPIKREPYVESSENVDLSTAKVDAKEGPIEEDHDDFHSRAPTRSGHQIDDHKKVHTSIRTRQPPGGASSGSLW